MAHRDRSQGFGFVYVDIKKLLDEKEQVGKAHPSEPIDTQGAQVVNFNKQSVPAHAPKAVLAPAKDDTRERSAAIQQIRDNLDRLQALHHRLHAMLEELNQITDKKKK